jgi:hypothetical protein
MALCKRHPHHVILTLMRLMACSCLQEFGGNVPTCSPSDEARMQPLMTKREVLDRYSQHTVHCKHCKQVRTGLPIPSHQVNCMYPGLNAPHWAPTWPSLSLEHITVT